ncbi:MAG TPA: VOC family protein [Acidimicrobiales bacterium]|nr:VOC family protein [Acidimicrobiales bacterium]
MHLDLVTLIVEDYDQAVQFYVGVLGFNLVEDSPAQTAGGRPKRWVVVRPAGAQTGFVLARADGPEQEAVLGNQAGGRVAFFLRVDDVDETYARLLSEGVRIIGEPRSEPYGRVAVFLDLVGNRWDLLDSRKPR